MTLPNGSIRTKDHGVWKRHLFRHWGYYALPDQDPEGQSISLKKLNEFKLLKDFPRLPANQFTAIIKLFQYWCSKSKHSSALEVQVLLLRGGENYQTWDVVVPEQKVTSVSVRAVTSKGVNLLTGKPYEVFPPYEGYAHAGSAHSHNTMGAFWSSGSPESDDSDLACPGLHFVVGTLHKQWTAQASIVHHGVRYVVPLTSVVDATILPTVEFHPAVLEVIQYQPPKPMNQKYLIGANTVGYFSKKGPRFDSHVKPKLSWSADPFFVGEQDQFMDEDTFEDKMIDLEMAIDRACSAVQTLEERARLIQLMRDYLKLVSATPV